MKGKRLIVPVLVGLAALAVMIPGSGGDLLTVLAGPFVAAGSVLRTLSLSGGIGNGVSLAAYMLLCLWPLVIWWRSERRAEDWLLVVLCGVLVFVMYLMVNPGLRPGLMQNEVGDVIYAGAVWSILVSWGILKLLRSSDAILEGNIYRALRIFLAICAGSCIVNGCILGLSGLMDRIRTLQEGNTMFGVNLWPTYVMYALDFAAGALEDGLLAVVFLKGVALLSELELDPYSAGCVKAGEQVALWCRRTLGISAAADLGLNLMQVFLAGMLHDVSVTVRLPITAIAVCFAMLALTRLLGQGKAIKDDNDLFI